MAVGCFLAEVEVEGVCVEPVGEDCSFLGFFS